jgi:exopolyphosphatase/guanosine-5'-triphosphate,3'-diphosphate pyrophosphatase
LETRAAIDIGTNSVKLLVASVSSAGIEVVEERVVVTRLGEDLHASGRIGEEAAARTLGVLAEFVAAARERGAQGIAVVGTMGLRMAGNADEFLARSRALGVSIEILSGEEEARLSYRGARSILGRAEGEMCVFDIGGGSVEFASGRGDRIEKTASLPIGVRFLTDRFLRSDPVAARELEELLLHVKTALAVLPLRAEKPVGVGGTAATIAAIMRGAEPFDPARTRGTEVALVELERQIDLLRPLPVGERKKIKGLPPERADVILAGAAVARAVLAELGARSFVVSDRGLRHGLLEERFLPQT